MKSGRVGALVHGRATCERRVGGEEEGKIRLELGEVGSVTLPPIQPCALFERGCDVLLVLSIVFVVFAAVEGRLAGGRLALVEPTPLAPEGERLAYMGERWTKRGGD